MKLSQLIESFVISNDEFEDYLKRATEQLTQELQTGKNPRDAVHDLALTFADQHNKSYDAYERMTDSLGARMHTLGLSGSTSTDIVPSMGMEPDMGGDTEMMTDPMGDMEMETPAQDEMPGDSDMEDYAAVMGNEPEVEESMNEDESKTKKVCKYCGGDCPNDEDHACDGYSGDIDGLYEASDEDEKTLKRAFAKAGEPERGEKPKKVSVKKAPWEESVNEAGGYYTQPVYDMIEKHGIEKVMHELLTALDADVIQDAMSRMGKGLVKEAKGKTGQEYVRKLVGQYDKNDPEDAQAIQMIKKAYAQSNANPEKAADVLYDLTSDANGNADGTQYGDTDLADELKIAMHMDQLVLLNPEAAMELRKEFKRAGGDFSKMNLGDKLDYVQTQVKSRSGMAEAKGKTGQEYVRKLVGQYDKNDPEDAQAIQMIKKAYAQSNANPEKAADVLYDLTSDSSDSNGTRYGDTDLADELKIAMHMDQLVLLNPEAAQELRKEFKRVGGDFSKVNLGDKLDYVQTQVKSRSGMEEAKGNDVNDDEVRELVLFADNDGTLYSQSTAPIQKNLSKKFTKGTYDHDKAIVLWKYHADRAAKMYGIEHGNNDGFRIFSPAVRKAAAKEFADAWQMELEAGNLHEAKDTTEYGIVRYPDTAISYIKKTDAGWEHIYDKSYGFKGAVDKADLKHAKKIAKEKIPGRMLEVAPIVGAVAGGIARAVGGVAKAAMSTGIKGAATRAGIKGIANKMSSESVNSRASRMVSDAFNEASKPDFADIDGDGDKKEPMKKAAKDKKSGKKGMTDKQKKYFGKK